MVWIPPDINTRIGGGRWVEVDDNGIIVDNTGSNNVEKVPRPVSGRDIVEHPESVPPTDLAETFGRMIPRTLLCVRGFRSHFCQAPS